MKKQKILFFIAITTIIIALNINKVGSVFKEDKVEKVDTTGMTKEIQRKGDSISNVIKDISRKYDSTISNL